MPSEPSIIGRLAPVPVRVVLLPRDLKPADVDGRLVVVFDVLRATTTMTAALAAGIDAIHLHATLDEARAAYGRDPLPPMPPNRVMTGRVKLLVGEHQCLKPADFDFGNSPGQFAAFGQAATSSTIKNGHWPQGTVIHMATTNGTRALLSPSAIGRPQAVFAGCVRNRTTVARVLSRHLDGHADCLGVTLLCAGTDGEPSLEDLLGCGAVYTALSELTPCRAEGDLATVSQRLWDLTQIERIDCSGNSVGGPGRVPYSPLVAAAKGAVNLRNAGLEEDIVFAFDPSPLDVLGVLEGRCLIRSAVD